MWYVLTWCECSRRWAGAPLNEGGTFLGMMLQKLFCISVLTQLDPIPWRAGSGQDVTVLCSFVKPSCILAHFLNSAQNE